MTSLVKEFFGKTCVIYTFNNTQVVGEILQLEGSAILVQTKKAQELINLDFVLRIREYPQGKKGKA